MTEAELDAVPDEMLGTAAEHATMRVPIASPADRVGDVVAGLRGQRFDSADVVAVCLGNSLVGLLTIERLFAARADTAVAEVMDPDPPTIGPGANQERAAWTAVQHGEPGLAVVDAGGRFRGLIPPQRLLAVLLAEHDEDIARLGGFLASTKRARLASTEPVLRRLWHRLPWLLVTGITLGVVLGATAFPVVLLIWGDSDVALTVAIALFAASSVATVVAMALPWTISRFGKDPAFGAGPLATVIQDLVSILIYFATATAILTG